jgi:hypothetical protein
VVFWVISGGGKTGNHSIHKTCTIRILIRESDLSRDTPRFFRFYSNLEQFIIFEVVHRKFKKTFHPAAPDYRACINEGTDGTAAWVKSQTDLNFTFSQEKCWRLLCIESMPNPRQGDYFISQ